MTRDVADADEGAFQHSAFGSLTRDGYRGAPPLAEPSTDGVELPLPRHGAERLVEDLEALERGLLGDVQRRVEADDGRVGHRDRPRRRHSWKSAFVKSFETSSFVVPVLDELEAEQEPLAAHVADDAVLLLHRLQPREHRAPDALGVLDEVLARR